MQYVAKIALNTVYREKRQGYKMERKIEAELLSKLEGKNVIHKIPKELGISMKHEIGKKLLLIHDDAKLLDLAVDTMHFWVADPTDKKDILLCHLENKKVVWKFCGSYARKACHLFEDKIASLKTSRDVEVRENNHLKKNISRIEVFCEYDGFVVLDPEMEDITKQIENLCEETVSVKPSEKVKVRKFVENKLDYDKSVFCVFEEKDNKLTIFSKEYGNIERVIDEFKKGPQMKKTEKKESSKTDNKPLTIPTSTNEKRSLSVSTTQTKSNSTGEMGKTFKQMDRSLPSKGRGQDDDLSHSRFSVNHTMNSTGSDMSSADASLSSKEASYNRSTREISETDASSKGSVTKQYSPDINVGIGSNFRYDFTLNGMTVSVYKCSIIEVKDVDAIVNAANEHMAHVGGVAYHISKAAGKKVDDEGRDYIKQHGSVKVGDNCITSAGNLPYRGIIHAVGPQWADYIGRENKCAEALHKTVKNILLAAKQKGWRRIALCAISAGIYGVPKSLCADMYLKALVDFSEENTRCLKDVHFVDVNLDILGLIKDAHEKWRRSPGSIDFSNAFKYPSATRKKPPTNTTQYITKRPRLVEDIRQSKTTFDNSPLYEFLICEKMKVKIYTGDLLRVGSVDAIVCTVNGKLDGGLARAIKTAGGQEYQKDLMNTSRRGRSASFSEGDIIVSKAGRLRVERVVHAVILQPIDKVNTEALHRLQLLNQTVLEKANTSLIRRLAMPLIGAGILRDNHDVAQCSERLAQDIVEFCNVNQATLRIKELHIVHQDVKRTGVLHAAFLKLANKDQTTRADENADTTSKTRDPAKLPIRADIGNYSSETFKNVETTEEERSKSLMTLTKRNIRCVNYENCQKQALYSLTCGHACCDTCIDLFKDYENCYRCRINERSDDAGTTMDTNAGDSCPVCLSALTKPSLLPCGHQLCSTCLDELKQHKPCCPLCNKAFGMITGTQPEGTMEFGEIKERLPGYESCNSIMIIYNFPNGKQGKEHPKPGQPYKGTRRQAFLPNNREGETILKLLQVAFDRRLIFTIGDSRTTGKEDRVTWNDIHHKTAIHGGTEKFAYPDPDYLSRVKDELAAKGVTEECLKNAETRDASSSR